MRRKLVWLFSLLVVTALAAAAFVLQAPASDSAASAAAQQGGRMSLLVDKSDRRLYMYVDGQLVRSFPVAVGKPSYPTPTGTYYIRHITWNPRWVPPDSKWARHRTAKAPGAEDNPMGNVKMFFKDGGYYIHGTRDYDSLGAPESHGCIRMANGQAVGLAEELMAHGGKNLPPSWFDQVLDRVHHSREVYLSNPVPLTIRG